MTQTPFYDRLRQYFLRVSEVLRGQANTSSIFPNTTDIGQSREMIYAKFLRQHSPSKCNVYLGGFLYGESGEESKQLDVIISTDTSPRYNFHNENGEGKSFGPVEGCLGVASIKTKITRDELFDALLNIASIPPTQPLGDRVNPSLQIDEYEEWPLKIIYAIDSLQHGTILGHITDFYSQHPEIPIYRRPDIIHVAGQYVIFKIRPGMILLNHTTMTYNHGNVGEYQVVTSDSDLHALLWTLKNLQEKAALSTHILFDYSHIINGVFGVTMSQ